MLTSSKVHRNILAGRSIWFKKAFFGNFKVCGRPTRTPILAITNSRGKEAEERKIKLQETAWRVDMMLYFFYTGGG